MHQTAALAREFERESARIDQLIWDAMALRAGESALFCGLSNNIDWIKRAVAIGVDVSVISNDAAGTRELRRVPINVLRGSTSMLPARDASFDAAIAFHYLHEVDPFFHASVVSELSRVGKRCVIVEPAPPSDPLGLRIASLYSRAKRELGQFENYHHIDYWRKLLAIGKSDVTYQTFTFTRTPPPEAIRDTVAFIIDTMAAEKTPEPYIAELRALAKRPDEQLLPQARFVVVGTAAGKPLNCSAGTDYRDRPPAEQRPGATVSSLAPTTERAGASSAAATAGTNSPRIYTRDDIEPEFPSVEAPHASATAPRPVIPAAHVARDASEPARGSVAGDDAALPDDPANAAVDFGWDWESSTGS